MTNFLLDAALAYAARGWPVFPCHPKTKAPLVEGADRDEDGKAVPRTGGLWRATDDPGQIREWWNRWPHALIGLPTGSRSGVFVIDLDPKDVALETVLRTLTDAVGALPQGPRSMTQSGGMHIWFALPLGDAMPKNSAKRLERIDWRGDGGYVIVPPSVMADGKSYRWLVSPDEMEFPTPPPRVLDLVFQRGEFARPGSRDGIGTADAISPGARPARISDDPAEAAIRKYAHGALERVRADVARTQQGSRGQELNSAAFAMGPFIELGVLTEREVIAALQDGADACGLTATDGAKERDAKIERGIASGRSKGKIEDLRRKVDEIRAEAGRRSARRPEAPFGDEGDGSGEAEHAASPDDGGDGGGAGGPGDGGADDGEPDPWKVAEACAAEPQNDTGNGRRLMAWHRHEMLNVRDVGEHAWAGTHWELRGGKEAFQRFAQDTAEAIALEARWIQPTPGDQAKIDAAKALEGIPVEDLTDMQRGIVQKAEEAEGRLQKRRGDRRKFSISCGNTNRINGMIAQALPHMTVAPEEMDADPFAINLLNGTLRVVKERVEDPDCPDPDVVRWITRWTVRLDPHRRSDRITRVMPVEWKPDATCPRWLAAMERFQPKPGPRRFLQQWRGYGLTGMMGEQAFVFHYGLGANFKSTFMETLARIQGDYAQSLPAEALTGDQQRRGDQATPEFARLPGARYVRCAELPRGQGFRESTIKMLTGGEPILVRHLHKGFFEFRPRFKAEGSGNDRPPIGGVDEGIWRRMKLVLWPVTIPPEERRPMERVIAEFMEEAPGILRWLVDGLLDYLENGLVVPDEIKATTDEYREDMDPVGEFCRACVEPSPVPETDPGGFVQARAMYSAYLVWCRANSVKPFQEKTFAAVMVQKGFRKENGRLRKYLGVRLHNLPEDPDAAGQGGRPPWPDES